MDSVSGRLVAMTSLTQLYSAGSCGLAVVALAALALAVMALAIRALAVIVLAVSLWH